MIFYLESLFSVSDDILTINNVIALSVVLVVRTAAAGIRHTSAVNAIIFSLYLSIV